jgi:type I restriction enzyme R subunit
MNEAQTREQLIDPKLKDAGWGIVEGSRVIREYGISNGRIVPGGKRMTPDIADYVLVYNNQKIGVIEAKKDESEYTEGLTQAKQYAAKLQIENTYCTNGKRHYHVNMTTGYEGDIDRFPTPDELWAMVSKGKSDWHARFNAVDNISAFEPRYYQDLAVKNALDGIAAGDDRLLLTLATGTGKTKIAALLVWKLFYSRWTLKRDGARRPRTLFLTDRNNLANQAFNEFSMFDENALARVDPLEIRKKGSVPKNASIFFTIFQTFMSGSNDTPYFGEYSPDFFDLIIIDECHRGGANDESSWRDILEYFSPAVQLGLTATPKRKDNVDTYRYFGEPLYQYSLKQGINDGFLTPFKVRRTKTSLDEYVYSEDDDVVEGVVDPSHVYTESDFNRSIEIASRERKRVQLFMNEIDQREKTIVFCATQDHAAAVRDMINQMKDSGDPHYCVRVTAADGERGDKYLREFQDNEKTIPTVLTSSRKLSTGVDARNVRNVVLMRPIKSMIEFKQIIGRGTRLYEGKEYFTIYDFVNASEMFEDAEWDGEPLEPLEPVAPEPQPEVPLPDIPDEKPCSVCGKSPCECERPGWKKLKIKLGDGKERQIVSSTNTYFYDTSGTPVTVQQFIEKLYGAMPDFYTTEDDLRAIWANPETRDAFLARLAELGFGVAELETVQSIIDATDSDLFDVLAYISFLTPPTTRRDRVEHTRRDLGPGWTVKEVEFLDFVLGKFEVRGSDELGMDKLATLLQLKYHSISDAIIELGGVDEIRARFVALQKLLFDAA